MGDDCVVCMADANRDNRAIAMCGVIATLRTDVTMAELYEGLCGTHRTFVDEGVRRFKRRMRQHLVLVPLGEEGPGHG